MASYSADSGLAASFGLRVTEDGSTTFFSPQFGETFHSLQGAWQEAVCKFVEPTRLPELAARRSPLALLDVCYGLGYNTAAALLAIWSVNPDCEVVWFGLEQDLTVVRAGAAHVLASLAAQGPLVVGADDRSLVDRVAQVITALADRDRLVLSSGSGLVFSGQLLVGDARGSIAQIPDAFQAEAIFLDPFSPPRCPQLWTVEFLAAVAARLAPTGRLATYSCAPAVRSALGLAGLAVGASPPFGRRWPGTVAARSAEGLPPLSDQEREHLQTRAAVPYRDPDLRDSAETILDRKRQEQATSPLEPTSRWKRRWFGDCRAKH